MIVDYKNTPIHVDVYGTGGSPLILLHGFLENNRIWKPFIPLFEDKFQVICPDLLGHGLTPKIGDIFTMEKMADVVHVIMDAFEINSAQFIGHSMGGYITLAFADKHPDRIDALMLLNSSAEPDPEERLEERDQAMRVVQKHKKIFLKSSIGNLFTEENRKKFEKDLNRHVEDAMEMKIDSIIASLKGMKIREDRTEVLRNFKERKWIVAGEEDPIIPYESLQNLAKNTQTEIRKIPGGHMSYIEQKDKVAEAFKEFLFI